ncbi:MAG TPA: Gfo/Idh/MocA family oxidoreductase [Sedimentisphaerales bacterium]|nr:Gfo/Idh/MocA family oxidoreductase [Sedimentisphaerales bacterium]
MISQKQFSRRQFITGTAAAMTFSIVPRGVLGGPGRTSPSEKINLVGIGVGGVGHGQLQSCDKQNAQIVALCDVDDEYAAKSYNKWPQARRYRDYRKMLESEKDIDAVYVGTPDHTHALITIAALRKGKHVCCVKPLTRTIYECRKVVVEARKANVATQVTAAANSTEAGCKTCEMIWDGAIGDVREVHIWSNRPLWPQGMRRPKGADPVPETFDWDLWLGPARKRPFKNKWPQGHLTLEQISVKNENGWPKAVYHPWNFRGWWDFGTGVLGDMGCHHFNIPKRALKLGHPVSISATSTKVMSESAPLASIVTWEFPAREGMPPLKAVWYDGGLKPPRPSELEAGRELPQEAVLYIGDKGKMLNTRIIPESKMKAYTQPPKTLKRRGGTWPEWFEAMRGGQSAACRFDWAGPLTEIILLGNIAIRTGKQINWDGDNMQITNDRDANKYIKEPYHNGWSLEA